MLNGMEHGLTILKFINTLTELGRGVIKLWQTLKYQT